MLARSDWTWQCDWRYPPKVVRRWRSAVPYSELANCSDVCLVRCSWDKDRIRPSPEPLAGASSDSWRRMYRATSLWGYSCHCIWSALSAVTWQQWRHQQSTSASGVLLAPDRQWLNDVTRQQWRHYQSTIAFEVLRPLDLQSLIDRHLAKVTSQHSQHSLASILDSIFTQFIQHFNFVQRHGKCFTDCRRSTVHRWADVPYRRGWKSSLPDLLSSCSVE